LDFWTFLDFRSKHGKVNTRERHGYPRVLEPHALHYFFGDHLKGASSIYQQMELAMALSSTAFSPEALANCPLFNKSLPPLSFLEDEQDADKGQPSILQPLW